MRSTEKLTLSLFVLLGERMQPVTAYKDLKARRRGETIHIEGLEWDLVSKPFAQGNNQRQSL